MSTGHPANCTECQPCEACGQAAFCLSEIVPHPCAHHGHWCPDCNIENCVDCRREAEQDMYATGVYDRRSDPFVNHLAPPPVDHIAVNGGYWWDGSFVPVPPKEKP